jgi:hypothetical protein
MKALARCFLVAGLCLAAALSAACQSQGEGEHCDKLNGNGDCASDLICGDSLVCCQPGSAACLATSTSGTAGAAGSAGSPNDASSESAAGNDAEASTTDAETGVDTGNQTPPTTDAADAAAE